MIDNKSQVEKYKEEIAEKENYFQVRIHFSISSWPWFLIVEILGGNRAERNCQYRGLPASGEDGRVGGGAGETEASHQGSQRDDGGPLQVQ